MQPSGLVSRHSLNALSHGPSFELRGVCQAWMNLRVGCRLKDGRADDSFMKTIKYESGKLQLNAFNKPDYFSNRKEIITIQFTSADKVRANPWVHGSDPS
jgi:hypothetical protein